MNYSIVSRKMSRDARKRVIKDFFETYSFISPFQRLDHYTNSNINKDAQALCLYAALLWVGVDKTENIDCDTLARKQDENARQLLREKNRYRNLREDAFNEAVDEIIKKEVRNCFAHGHFEISETNLGEKCFVLRPERTVFNSQEKIIVPFKSVCGAVAECINKQSQASESDRYFQNVAAPSLIMDMYSFYSLDKSLNVNKMDFGQLRRSLIVLETALLSADFTCNENDYYADFGKDSEIFKMISLIRNSLVHGTLRISPDGKTIYIDNANERNLHSHTENLSNFVSKIVVADVAMDLNNIGKELNSESKIDAAKGIVADGFLEGESGLKDILIHASEILFSIMREENDNVGNEK